jgi:hypothetical protein
VVIGELSVWSGLRTANLTEDPPMTDAMMSLKSLMEKTPTRICCGR